MDETTPETLGGLPPRTWFLAGTGLVVLVAAELVALQYVMPETYTAAWGLDHPGTAYFREVVLGSSPSPMGSETFRQAFRALLITAWVGYALAVGAGLSGGASRVRATVALSAAVAAVFAVLCPPSLSADSYAYVAYARLWAYYGLNPYVTAPDQLEALGDPSYVFAGYLETPCVYSSVWTMGSAALVALLRRPGLWWQVVAFKLIAGASLVGSAAVGARVADHFHPGRGRVTAVAIGLNPLFLLEGPGNGHNDLLMAFLMLLAVDLGLRGRRWSSALALGLSVGVKFLPLLALPWIIVDQSRGRRLRATLLPAVATAALVLGPTALCYVPVWRGRATFTAQAQRTQWSPNSPELPDAAGRLLGLGAPPAVAAAGQAAVRQWPVTVTYALLTLWVVLLRPPLAWLDAWPILSGVLIVWTMGVWFPWYMAWPWLPLLTRWDTHRVCLSSMCWAFSLALQLNYTAGGAYR